MNGSQIYTLELDADADAVLSLDLMRVIGLDTQTANYALLGPTTGAAAAPTFRALVADDIPDLSGTYLTSDGTTPLTADWDAGEYEIKAKSFDVDDSSDSGVTNAIRFGDNQEAIVYRDGTDLVISPQDSGDGVVSVPTGGITLTKGLKLIFNG